MATLPRTSGQLGALSIQPGALPNSVRRKKTKPSKPKQEKIEEKLVDEVRRQGRRQRRQGRRQRPKHAVDDRWRFVCKRNTNVKWSIRCSIVRLLSFRLFKLCLILRIFLLLVMEVLDLNYFWTFIKTKSYNNSLIRRIQVNYFLFSKNSRIYVAISVLNSEHILCNQALNA